MPTNDVHTHQKDLSQQIREEYRAAVSNLQGKLDKLDEENQRLIREINELEDSIMLKLLESNPYWSYFIYNPPSASQQLKDILWGVIWDITLQWLKYFQESSQNSLEEETTPSPSKLECKLS